MNANSVMQIAKRAKAAAPSLALLSTQTKNVALAAMADALLKNQNTILKANALDVSAARKKNVSESLIARLALDASKIKKMAESVISISRLPDPVDREISSTRRPNGLLIRKVSVPIGVILIIFESRPNVTVDCAALCLKSGNSVILKGGSEALHSNQAIFKILSGAALRKDVPKGALEFVVSTDRAVVRQLLGLAGLIDLVIPRGGEELIREVVRVSKIPVIKHTKGVCHVFIDEAADWGKSKAVVLNAKVQNPAVCNAMETLLIHEKAAPKFLPELCRALKAEGVEIRGDKLTRKYFPAAKKATQKDWTTEYLDLILSVRVVKNLDEAIDHVERYGSHHSDAIMTKNPDAAARFARCIDSACVFVNSSTRFNDGGEFGMGAEMGISTDKLHARGPMGLEELTSYKYVVTGDGQVRG